MFNKKLQVEKVEMVKKVIRANDYSDYEKTHKQCVELGLNVNRPALDRFAQKLQQLDKTAKSKVEFDDGSFEEPGKQQMATDLDSALDAEGRGAAGGLSFDEIKKREHEITFELGGLKIKENELLIELRTLRGKSNH